MRIPEEKIAEWKEAVEAVGHHMGGSRLGALAEGVTALLAEREEVLRERELLLLVLSTVRAELHQVRRAMPAKPEFLDAMQKCAALEEYLSKRMPG